MHTDHGRPQQQVSLYTTGTLKSSVPLLVDAWKEEPDHQQRRLTVTLVAQRPPSPTQSGLGIRRHHWWHRDPIVEITYGHARDFNDISRAASEHHRDTYTNS